MEKETVIYSKAQKSNLDENVEHYINNLENIIQKKMHMYKQLARKIRRFKVALDEEEEIHTKFRSTFTGGL